MPRKLRPKKPALKKPTKGKETGAEDGLWIAPRYSLKGPTGERAWENRPGGPPNSGRLLELADIALGLKKPQPKQLKAPAGTHVISKKDPYSTH
jgi:hypothetical protein